jgi:hypothetical protein
MATRAVSVLPLSTFPAPGVAAAIHRAVTAAAVDPRPRRSPIRPAPVLSLDAARSGLIRWPHQSPVRRRLEPRPSLIR